MTISWEVASVDVKVFCQPCDIPRKPVLIWMQFKRGFANVLCHMNAQLFLLPHKVCNMSSDRERTLQRERWEGKISLKKIKMDKKPIETSCLGWVNLVKRYQGIKATLLLQHESMLFGHQFPVSDTILLEWPWSSHLILVHKLPILKLRVWAFFHIHLY